MNKLNTVVLASLIGLSTGCKEEEVKVCKPHGEPIYLQEVQVVKGFYKGQTGVIVGREYAGWDNDCSPNRIVYDYTVVLFKGEQKVEVRDWDLEVKK